ncbi:ALF repeat-containing protein [Streptomyces sp. CRN 30]|uniref:ALF repeat-containing protein n=1 Tax=Streptomyces sp. CRN 30 TaxID=3075613 RepID=UPI002A81565E|nr:ALF repeat-containing protein [Streptomyces sp. CRN 30]
MRSTRTALTVAAAGLSSALLLAAPATAAPAFAAQPTGTASATGAAATAAAQGDSAADGADDQVEEDRVATFRILAVARENDDEAVAAAATAALEDGSPEALRAFLETGYPAAQFEDDRFAAFRILAVAERNDDVAVKAAVVAALEDGSPEALRAFRVTGYPAAQFEDDRVAVFRILADPAISSALREAAEQALEDGTPEALRYFRLYGQYEVD